MGNTTLPYFIDAIFIAHNGAERMSAQGYTAHNTTDEIFGASFKVITPQGREHTVYPFGLTVVDAPSCSCEQCDKEGYCKHIVWTADIANGLSEYEYRMQDDERIARMSEEREYADFNIESGYGS